MANKRPNKDIRNFLSPKKIKTEEPPSPGSDATHPRAGDSGHAFRFRYNKDEYDVTCDSSMTVLEALLTNSIFKSFYEKEKGKEMVILREAPPRGAVSTDFPCCQIANNELLDIKFIKSGGNTAEKKPDTSHSAVISPGNVVVFNVKTTGGKNIKRLMKNHELKNEEVDYVCVYALRGEKVRKALRRDGRFKDVIFKKNCALRDLSSDHAITAMSNTAADSLDGKSFQVIVKDNQPASQSSSQEMELTEPEAPSSPKPQSETADQDCQDSAKALQNPQPTGGEGKSGTRPKQIQVKDIPNTEEVLKLLRDQFGDLLEQLKKRESLTKPAEVQKFFREEFDKSAQSFSELKRVRLLVELSDSVCLIRVGEFPKGTGFLLFDRFILTNAHVVENEFDQKTWSLRLPVTAVFGYEDLREGREVKLADVVAFHKGKNERGQHLDFALLELSDDEKLPACTELLKIYSPPPIRGGICIIGHPGCEVKKMDPCFIIPEQDVPKARDKHVAENINFLYVIQQQNLAENWKHHYNQISYDSCFFHGSSGSPVFNDHCQLIGVHTGGYAYKGEGGKTRSLVEYSFPMLPILECIIRQCRLKNRSDVVKYFEAQNNMKYVLQVANEQIQG